MSSPVNPPQPQTRSTRRAAAPALRGDIQGMRAVAVLLVLLAHGGIAGFAGGYVGVDVFFVISGFLITGILVREVRTKGQVSIADFYARRARRILPAATVTLAAITVASALLLQPNRLADVVSHVRWAALFAANIYSAQSGSDYFSEEGFVSPVQHYWSLAVEEQFYLVWPALIAAIIFLGRRRLARTTGTADSSGATTFRLRQIAVALAVLSILSMAWSVYQTAHNPNSAYYSTFTRGWELAIGAGLALIQHRISRVSGSRVDVAKAGASWLGLILIAYAALSFTETTPFPGIAAAVPTVGAALVLAGGVDGPHYGARLLLDTPPMRWVGDISYSLYLWHWPVLILAGLYAARDLTLAERLALMALSIGLAWLTYRYVETPFRRHRALAGSLRRSLAMWPIAVVAVLVATLGSTAASNAIAQGSAGDVGQIAQINASASATTRAQLAAVQAKAAAPLPATLKPTLDTLFDDVSRLPTGCGVERDGTEIKTCAVGDKNGSKTVVLFGDSHAIMWLAPLEQIAQQRGWKIIGMQKASCFPTDAVLWRQDTAAPYTDCTTWRTKALATMAELKPDLIIASGYTAYLAASPDGSRILTNAQKVAAAPAPLQSMLKRLTAIAPEVVFIGGTPTLAQTAGDCLGSARSDLASCVTAPDKVTVSMNDVIKKSAAAAGVTYVDPMPWLCADNTCPLIIGDTIVYRDTNHLTTTFARTVLPELTAALPDAK